MNISEVLAKVRNKEHLCFTFYCLSPENWTFIHPTPNFFTWPPYGKPLVRENPVIWRILSTNENSLFITFSRYSRATEWDILRIFSRHLFITSDIEERVINALREGSLFVQKNPKKDGYSWLGNHPDFAITSNYWKLGEPSIF